MGCTSPYLVAEMSTCFTSGGAVPVFAAIDARTYNLDPAAVEAALTERTKAIVAVDIYGYPCELDPLRAIAEKHGLAFIQDSCEALGAEYKGAQLGTHGPPAVGGGWPNEQRAAGGGGSGATQSGGAGGRMRSRLNQGRGDAGGWLEHVGLGFNYRLDDVSAAIGIGQVEKLDEILRLRSVVAERYTELLAGIDGVELPCADDAEHKRSWFVYVVALPDNAARERVIGHFERERIGFNRYLPSIHLQPYMRERYGFREGLCPVSEDLSSRTLALPFFTALERDAQERVAEALAAAL